MQLWKKSPLSTTQKPSPDTQKPSPDTQKPSPDTQLTVPSPQLTIPSTQMTTPSTQLTIPSTQLTNPGTQLTDPATRPQEIWKNNQKHIFSLGFVGVLGQTQILHLPEARSREQPWWKVSKTIPEPSKITRTKRLFFVHSLNFFWDLFRFWGPLMD